MSSKRVLFGSSSDQIRASWSPDQVTSFLEQLVVEKNVGNWSSKSPSTQGYINIVKLFEQKYGKCFKKLQLKSKFESLRSLFHLWITMFNGQTGAGFDTATGRMTMDEEWWDNAIKINPNYKKFRDEGLENADLMYNVFGDGSATGMYQFTPTANNPRFRNNFSQVAETDEEIETSPIHRPNYEVNSPIRATQETGPSRISGGKRKTSGDSSWSGRLDALRQEFSSVPMATDYVCRHENVNLEEREFPTKKALDILYDIPDLDADLFDIGLYEIQNVQFRKVWLMVRSHDDRVRMLKKKRV